ncbi:hypothetical protein RQP46_000031 [Phenoliferia psychrophenolica]
MHVFRSLAFVASALFFAHSSSARPTTSNDSGVSRRGATLTARLQQVDERKMIRARSTVVSPPTSLVDIQAIIDVLAGKTGPISDNIKSIATAAPTTPKLRTAKSVSVQYSSLQVALNVALAGVTQLVAGLDLAGTVVNVVTDLQTALNTVEAGLAIDPALAPLATALAAITNGPLAQLLLALEGLLSGLLPVVNGLLAGLGLAPVLVGVQGLVDGLLTGLGA